ncbi:MAG: DUF3871 family protein [Chitinophagales bacterium]
MEQHTIKNIQLNGKGDNNTSPLTLKGTPSIIRIEEENAVNDNFIAANTTPITLLEIKNKHTIPVYVKDNTPCISQVEYIETTMNAAKATLNKPIANLAIRVSHPIKGRTFEARSKKAADLLDHEKTIYNERMAFVFELPYFKENINGQELTLTVAGIKAYNNDNLYSYGGSLQKFKIGIGYKVKVCTNLCIFTDGASLEIKARNVEELQSAIIELFESASFLKLIPALQKFGEYELTELQFATLLGKTRLYNHLPAESKREIPPLLISDSQISTVAKEYYNNGTFMRNSNGSINLWSLYNLFTDSIKSSYIDTFLDRNLNAFEFTSGIVDALEGKEHYSWFLK